MELLGDHRIMESRECIFENLVIRDVIVRDFELAGMAMNGFIGLDLLNVDVSPVYQQVPVMGVYTHARIMLPRLRMVAADNQDRAVKFANRGTYSANEVLSESQTQMNLMFDHFINGIACSDMATYRYESPQRIAAA